ncbi:hypothetical protein [Mesorhizobium sp. SP-1A]|uniref:hypothetical protein n=1 Tax=Mesorhizobium sp. SP-1A TaxID=3077840 RepID=UPI0028F71B3B|nr:hypothetical protein [Mesorhizobium sp. SP-1A]
MRSADLKGALAMVEARAENIAMRDRLAAREPLRLLVGQGGGQSEIVLSAAYLADLRAGLVYSLNRRIAGNDAALARMGVEP